MLKKRKTFRSHISIDNKLKYLDIFVKARDAAMAHNMAIVEKVELFGGVAMRQQTTLWHMNVLLKYYIYIKIFFISRFEFLILHVI